MTAPACAITAPACATAETDRTGTGGTETDRTGTGGVPGAWGGA